MSDAQTLLGFDVGEKRIGVARAHRSPGIAFACTTLKNDEFIHEKLARLIKTEQPDALVVGLPRNQNGEQTKQTTWVKQWAAAYIEPLKLPFYWQDESVTSVRATEQLQSHKKSFHKAEVDARAAALILQDYIEQVWHAPASR